MKTSVWTQGRVATGALALALALALVLPVTAHASPIDDFQGLRHCACDIGVRGYAAQPSDRVAIMDNDDASIQKPRRQPRRDLGPYEGQSGKMHFFQEAETSGYPGHSNFVQFHDAGKRTDGRGDPPPPWASLCIGH